jgi:Tfp pilus assembly protein PilW
MRDNKSGKLGVASGFTLVELMIGMESIPPTAI